MHDADNKNIFSVYYTVLTMMLKVYVNAPIKPWTLWLQAILIIPVDESGNNNLSFVNCHHHHQHEIFLLRRAY
jgi:hypothetical protein